MFINQRISFDTVIMMAWARVFSLAKNADVLRRQQISGLDISCEWDVFPQELQNTSTICGDDIEHDYGWPPAICVILHCVCHGIFTMWVSKNQKK